MIMAFGSGIDSEQVSFACEIYCWVLEEITYLELPRIVIAVCVWRLPGHYGDLLTLGAAYARWQTLVYGFSGRRGTLIAHFPTLSTVALTE